MSVDHVSSFKGWRAPSSIICNCLMPLILFGWIPSIPISWHYLDHSFLWIFPLLHFGRTGFVGIAARFYIPLLRAFSLSTVLCGCVQSIRSWSCWSIDGINRECYGALWGSPLSVGIQFLDFFWQMEFATVFWCVECFFAVNFSVGIGLWKMVCGPPWGSFSSWVLVLWVSLSIIF